MEQSPKRKKKSKADIVALHGVAYSTGIGPAEDVVLALEDLLKRAKKGEIIGLAYALVGPGGFTECNWAQGRSGRNYLIASVRQLDFDLMRAAS